MISNQNLSYAIAAILSGITWGPGVAKGATAGADDVDSIQEITVTAQRRTENIQDVPITIQAISTEQMRELSIANFDDVIRYLPNVDFAENGPGQGNIFMRGLSPGSTGNQSQAAVASFPNVAIYLDDQSVQFPGRNLDIYAADMDRIEVLEGPQGTLFGGGAQAGAIRYITNKPKLDKVEGSADATYSVTAGGDPNTAINSMLNLPLIDDVLGVRAVIYSDHRGGYIDNVPSTVARQNTDDGTFRLGVPAGPGGSCPNGLPAGAVASGAPYGVCVPLGLPVTNNNAQAQNNQNPVDYTGIRVSALYRFSDDWSLLVQQSYQNMEADGVFAEFPVGSAGQALQPLQVTTFQPSYDKDRFENTSWTLNGKLGVLKAVYTGGYLIRNTNQQMDYSNYARGSYGSYYECTGGSGTVAPKNGAGVAQPAKCYSAATSWLDVTRNTHMDHEFRLSTPDEWRIRGLLGAFYEDFKIEDNMNFQYKTVPSCTPANLTASDAGGDPCVSNVGPAAGATTTEPGLRGDNTAFGEDLQRGYTQTALFTSIDYDLIPKTLTVTAGTRWYHYDEFETGSTYDTSGSCANVPNGGCPGTAKNLNSYGLRKTYNGFRSRGNITWHVRDDVMMYGTYSQGYRPGGFNRETGLSGVAVGADGVAQLLKPSSYSPDTLTNFEVGIKSEFLDHRVQANLSAYHMKWSNIQVPLFNPDALGLTTFVTNGPNYRVNGLELQLVARVTQGLTLQGSGSYNDARQQNNPCLIANNPASSNYGHCISQVYNPAGVLTPLLSPYGPQGGTPAFSPKLNFNARARYDWKFGDFGMFAMAGGNHIDKMYNQIDNGTTGYVGNPYTNLLRYEQPAYTTYDASLGGAKNNWTVEAFGTNLSNSNASVFTSSAQLIKSEVPLRPRILGLKVGYKF